MPIYDKVSTFALDSTFEKYLALERATRFAENVGRQYQDERKRRNLSYPLDGAQARQSVLSVDVHGARSADALATRPSERQRRVLVGTNRAQ